MRDGQTKQERTDSVGKTWGTVHAGEARGIELKLMASTLVLLDQDSEGIPDRVRDCPRLNCSERG